MDGKMSTDKMSSTTNGLIVTDPYAKISKTCKIVDIFLKYYLILIPKPNPKINPNP